MNKLDEIVAQIESYKAENPPQCGTALTINYSLWNDLIEEHGLDEIKEKLPHIDIFVQKSIEGYKIENWEWTVGGVRE